MLALLFLFYTVVAYTSELKIPKGSLRRSFVTSDLPHEKISLLDLPKSWDWGDVNGRSYLTKSQNQHIPQYCGSCWAFGALSSLSDRIKIARGGKGADIMLSPQFILNCATKVAGSCNGGDHIGVYEFIKSYGNIPFDTCLQYEACSHDSSEEQCKSKDFSCKPFNVCRTCNTFSERGGTCAAVYRYPNASIAEYGTVQGESNMLTELYSRGPISCVVNAEPIVAYEGGIFDDKTAPKFSNHIVSITGYGETVDGVKYWIARNSWGEYWGESGFFRIKRGENQLGIEAYCAWATPEHWTEQNFPCSTDGMNCASSVDSKGK